MNDNIKEKKQFEKMVNTPVKKLVLKLAVPTTVSMLVSAIYSIADTFFVSQMGKSASAAVGVVFSFMAVIQAVGFTLGMGSGSVISSLLGQRKEEEAQRVGSSAFYLSLVLGVLITVLCTIFINPILRFLGSTETALPYARDYGQYIILGAPIMAASYVLNNQLRAEGKAFLAMFGISLGGILNIFLDPLFITTFGFGISGAAIATLVSQVVSFSILLAMFVFKKSIIRLSVFKISADPSVYFEIIKVGLPSFCRQGLASLASILLNRQAKIYGSDVYLSAMTIISKMFLIIFSTCLGIGQGYQPVCGYNYFAKNYSRVKEAMIFTFIVATGLMTIVSGLCAIFSKQIFTFFIKDNEVIEVGTRALRFQCLAMPFMPLNTVCNMTFQSTRRKARATLLSCCRQGIFYVPIIIFLPRIIGLLGIELTQPIADIATCAFSLIFFISFFKEINIKIEEEKNNKQELNYEF